MRTIFGSHRNELIYLINQLIDHLVCIIKEGIYYIQLPELCCKCAPNYVVLNLTDWYYVHRENEVTRKCAAISNLLSIHA